MQHEGSYAYYLRVGGKLWLLSRYKIPPTLKELYPRVGLDYHLILGTLFWDSPPQAHLTLGLLLYTKNLASFYMVCFFFLNKCKTLFNEREA
jgi:hypothetical protein